MPKDDGQRSAIAPNTLDRVFHAERPNQRWSLDFVADQLVDGRRFRSECLNTHWFLTLADAAEKMEAWLRYYNEDCPHGAIGNKPPISLQNPGGTPSPSP